MTHDTLDIQTAPLPSRTSEVARQLRRPGLGGGPPPEPAWCPAVNVLRYVDRLEIIVDLAGLDPEDVHLSIKERSLRIYGVRPALESNCADSTECRVLMMEVEAGPFDRILTLSKEFSSDPGQVRTRQKSGVLWITIPASR